tara:strand:+ start:8592 stop:9026 length:435 start_codon:yes stop_codon:yes gene_type:complete
MNLLFGGVGIRSTGGNIGLLILRVFSGLSLAFAHGIGKVPPSERFIGDVEKLGFPMPALFAWAAGASELLGGVFLAAGFMTRPAAFFVAITMFVAAFLQHAADPFRGKEKALLFLCIAIFYFFVGAGRFSVDGFIRKQDAILEE